MTKICLRTCQNILLVTLEIIKCRMHVQNCIFEICQTPNTSLFTLFTSGGEGSVMAGNLATSHNTSHDIDTREESVGGGGREESRDMFEETNDEEEVEEAEDVNLVDLEEEDVKA